jgi:glycosyltransferase involved in cell wall biosynthesis
MGRTVTNETILARAGSPTPGAGSNVAPTTETAHAPLVSIGLAVYNGERYLREAIDSILAQTFTDFELIISDNASTDSTAAICLEYVTRDSRIRYHRNDTNIGGANNENLTFRMSRGKYFRWAAHDDIIAPNLLERCVEVMEAAPDIVLCHTDTIVIDQNSLYVTTLTKHHASSSDPVKRFRDLALSRDLCEETYGLVRSDVMRRTRLQQQYTNSDRTLLCELALHGRFVGLPEALFFKRVHDGNAYIDWRTRMAWFDPKYAEEGLLSFPYVLHFWDYLVTIKRSNLSKVRKIRLLGVIIFPWMKLNGIQMVKDTGIAVWMGMHSRAWRQRRYRESQNW